MYVTYIRIYIHKFILYIHAHVTTSYIYIPQSGCEESPNTANM